MKTLSTIEFRSCTRFALFLVLSSIGFRGRAFAQAPAVNHSAPDAGISMRAGDAPEATSAFQPADPLGHQRELILADRCSDERDNPGAENIPDVGIPALSERITDLTDHITPGCKRDLDERLAALERDTGTQIAVLMVPTVGGQAIERYAARVFEQWKLGRTRTDDGILLVVVIDNREARIEVGYGLEGTVTDAQAGDILRKDLQPYFREGHYNAGISATVADLDLKVRQAPASALPQRSHPTGAVFVVAMLLLGCLTGGIAAWFGWTWSLRLLVPLALVEFCVIVAVPLHLASEYRLTVPMVPLTIAVSLLGIPFVRHTKESLLLLASCLGAAFILCGIAALVAHDKGMTSDQVSPWYVAAVAGGLAFGSLGWFLTKLALSGTLRSSSANGRDNDDSGTSSSATSNLSNSGVSRVSDAGSFSGGGGESGGGGASTNW